MKEKKWISVKDKMPRVKNPNGGLSEPVLVSDGEHIAVGYFEAEGHIEFDSEAYDGPMEIVSAAKWNIYGWMIFEVLFWMPLPELPIEKH